MLYKRNWNEMKHTVTAVSGISSIEEAAVSSTSRNSSTVRPASKKLVV